MEENPRLPQTTRIGGSPWLPALALALAVGVLVVIGVLGGQTPSAAPPPVAAPALPSPAAAATPHVASAGQPTYRSPIDKGGRYGQRRGGSSWLLVGAILAVAVFELAALLFAADSRDRQLNKYNPPPPA